MKVYEPEQASATASSAENGCNAMETCATIRQHNQLQSKMAPTKQSIAAVLQAIHLGNGVAEHDDILDEARVETSAFNDLLRDRVDLIPGTKGSGKTALFRIFVEFLPDHLLNDRKVVVAHGVNKLGDDLFHAYRDEFATLDEEDFTNFWTIYLVSLAHEQFVKNERYADFLVELDSEVQRFRIACQKAGIPEIKARLSLKDVLGWTLGVLKKWKPRLKYEPPEGGVLTLDLFGEQVEQNTGQNQTPLPRYIDEIGRALEAILEKADLSIWLMIDRLDEVFPRRTKLESTGLRGLLRAMRPLSSDRIRIKVFIRDDMLNQVVESDDGFTALTHLTARQSDTLDWSQDQILDMLVTRLFLNETLQKFFKVDMRKLSNSRKYREECFYKVFPKQVHAGERQSSTISWIYNHTMDGRDVVTPRDVIQLVTRAIQRQQDEYRSDNVGDAQYLVGPRAIQYGLEELSKEKKNNFLKAEFPHLWINIEKFVGGKSVYSTDAIRKILGKGWEVSLEDLVAIGFLKRRGRAGHDAEYWIPYLYRKGLEITQGAA